MGNSVGSAAARGIESGVGLGMRLRNQQTAEEQITRRNAQEDEDRAYVAGERARKLERETDDDAMKALETQQAALLAEGEGLAARYGDAVPAEIGSDYARRKNEISGTRDGLLRKRYEPIIKKRQQAMQDLVSRLETGQVQIDEVADADLYQAFRTATRRDPKDLLGTDGKPSRVSAATTDLMTGIQTGNEGMTLAAANVLAEPELKVGVGHESPRGGTIVGKEIVKLIPHPENPEEFLPVIRVYVKKGNGKSDKPNGATGYYDAPVTENRTSDPDDPVKSISIKKAMDYAAQLQTLSVTLDRPDLRKKLERGAAEAAKDPEDFLSAFYALKGRSAPKIDYKTVPAGGTLVGLDPRGKEVVRIEGNEKTPTGLAGNVEAVQAYADENGMSFDEASALFQRRGLLRAPGKGGGAGGGGAGGGLAKPGSEGLTGEEFLKTLRPEDARIVKGLAEGTIKPESISMKDNRREHMLALANQYAPDGGGGGKALPQPVVKQLTEARDNAATISRATSSFKDEYAGKGLFGLGADKQMGVSAMVGADKDAVNWWKNYRKQAELIERHALFGASLTTGEQEAWRSADISPGMDPAVIKANLIERERLARKVLDNTKKDLIDAGHSEKRISAIADRDQTMPEIPAKPAAPGENPTAAGRGGPIKPAAAPAAMPPPAALSQLREGVVQTFRNGTRWTLQAGQPVQVQ